MEDPRIAALNLIRQDKNYQDELWLKYWANGGSAGSVEFGAYLNSDSRPDSFDLQILRWAIDDVIPAGVPLVMPPATVVIPAGSPSASPPVP